MANKKWFSARVLFVSMIDGHRESDPLCEESIILVNAEGEEDALKEADLVAKAMEHDYENEKGETVAWKLAGIVELQDLCEKSLGHGTEVFSHMFLGSQADSTEIRDLLDCTIRAELTRKALAQ